MTGHVG